MKTRNYVAVMVVIVVVVAFALFYYDPDPETEVEPGLFWDEQEGEQDPQTEDPEEGGGAAQDPGAGLKQPEQVPGVTARPGSVETPSEEAAQRGQPHREKMLESTEVLAEKTRELGYFTSEEREIYETYSIDVLETLLEQGDIRAYPVIIDKYANNDSREYVTWASFTAATHGSTPAIGMLAHIEASQAEYERLMENEQAMKEHLIHAQALYKSTSLLGDPYYGASAEEALAQFDLELDDGDHQRIGQLSEQFIAGLNERRRAQGLSELERASGELLMHYERLGISSPWQQ